MKLPKLFACLLLICIGFTACKPNKTVKLTVVEVPNESLTYHTPLEIPFKVEKKGKYNLELQIKYRDMSVYFQHKFSADYAPLFLRLTGPTNKNVLDKEFRFELKDGLGWRGAPDATGQFRSIRKDVYNSVPLEPGSYTLSIWSNAKGDHDEYSIDGIVEVGFGLRKMSGK